MGLVMKDWEVVESGGFVPSSEVVGIDWPPSPIIVVIVHLLVASGVILLKADCLQPLITQRLFSW